MTEDEAAELMARLRRAGAWIEPGLTDAEVAAVQARFGFEFCDDHRAFLQAGLPVDRVPNQRNSGWPDWRHGSGDQLRARLDKVADGVVFDILHNDFWPSKWGERPGNQVTAEAIGRQHLQEVPALIPLHGNRYLPSRSGRRWPVISAYQADVIHLTDSLAGWIEVDFEELTRREPIVTREHWVPFWSDVAAGVDPPHPKGPQLLNWPAGLGLPKFEDVPPDG